MSDSDPGSPLSQFSIEDDEIIWTHDSLSDSGFTVLRHPLLDAHSLPSTLSDLTGSPGFDDDLFSTLDKLFYLDHDPLADSSSSSAQSSDTAPPPSKNQTHAGKRRRNRASMKARRRAQSSSAASASSECRGGTSTHTPSYDEASAFISQFISSPVKGSDAELTLLRALIIELGLRSPTALDLPGTLTSARKVLKAEAHVNIKEYVATRHKGQSALRQILKPSKNALRKDIHKKGNRASLQWVKQQGLQVLLITCFA